MQTVKQRIYALGGYQAVAAALADGDQPRAQTLMMWASRDNIPWRWRAAFEQLERAARPVRSSSRPPRTNHPHNNARLSRG